MEVFLGQSILNILKELPNKKLVGLIWKK